MPREAKLFDAVKGSPVRALLRLNANIPPNWILRARKSRKSLEPDIVQAMKKLQSCADTDRGRGPRSRRPSRS